MEICWCAAMAGVVSRRTGMVVGFHGGRRAGKICGCSVKQKGGNKSGIGLVWLMAKRRPIGCATYYPVGFLEKIVQTIWGMDMLSNGR